MGAKAEMVNQATYPGSAGRRDREGTGSGQSVHIPDWSQCATRPDMRRLQHRPDPKMGPTGKPAHSLDGGDFLTFLALPGSLVTQSLNIYGLLGQAGLPSAWHTEYPVRRHGAVHRMRLILRVSLSGRCAVVLSSCLCLTGLTHSVNLQQVAGSLKSVAPFHQFFQILGGTLVKVQDDIAAHTDRVVVRLVVANVLWLGFANVQGPYQAQAREESQIAVCGSRIETGMLLAGSLQNLRRCQVSGLVGQDSQDRAAGCSQPIAVGFQYVMPPHGRRRVWRGSSRTGQRSLR